MKITEIINQWTETHGKNYVTHGIWSRTNLKILDEVFTSGQVLAAETVLRQTGSVDCEVGRFHGTRGTISLGDLATAKDLYGRLPKVIDIKFLLGTECEFFGSNFSPVDENDDKQWDHYRLFRASEIKRGKYHLDTLQSIAADMVTDDPIDSRLSVFWKSKVSPASNWIEKLHFAGQCTYLRYTEIPLMKLDESISAFYNDVSWSYGPVVIIKGNASGLIGTIPFKADGASMAHLIYRQGHFTESKWQQELMRCKPNDGDYVRLLAPYQNNGLPFSINLSDEDVIILGPKSKLEKFRENPKYNSYRIIFIEELTLEHMNFFKVPDYLRPAPTEYSPVRIMQKRGFPLQPSKENQSSTSGSPNFRK